jgi:hypothetical protein
VQIYCALAEVVTKKGDKYFEQKITVKFLFKRGGAGGRKGKLEIF